MDKYTVDLDKVLNDFEYSEYSLESAKLNRNVHEDLPNTSNNLNFPNKNNTTVKHSINNVFHSLNEYLSTDITPKKVENIQKTMKNVNFIKDLQSLSFSETETNIPDISRLQENSLNTLKCNITFESDVSNFPANHKENDLHNPTNRLIEKTEVFSDNFIVVSEETQEVEEKSIENMSDSNNIDVNPDDPKKDIIIIEHDTNPDRSSDRIENEFEDKDCLLTRKEVSEEILIDLGINNRNKDLATSEAANDVTSQEKSHSAVLPLNNEEIIPEVNISLMAPPNNINNNTGIVSEICEKDNDLIIEKQAELKDKKIKTTEKVDPEVVTVKFGDDYDLDEENLDQYFQELEQELGKHLEEVERANKETVVNKSNSSLFKTKEKEQTITESNESKGVESNIAINIIELEENELPENSKEKIAEAPKCEGSGEHSKIEEEYSESEIVEKKCLLEYEVSENFNAENAIDDSLDSQMKVNEISQPNVKDGESDREMVASMKIIIDEHSSTSKVTVNIVPKNDEPGIISFIGNQKEPDISNSLSINEKCVMEHTQEESQNAKQDLEKNFRPQHLLLTKENQDISRKIDLIGDPGSTPYNNVYSTRDFEKNNPKEDGSGESNAVRPVSPTYSDVSTDSVSSGTSNDAYDDAVSEIHGDQKKHINKAEIQIAIKDRSKGETVQNNMVSSNEVCRNDVTTGKHFKNNLKPNNSEETGESSKSNVQPEDKGSAIEEVGDGENFSGINIRTNEEGPDECVNATHNTVGASSDQSTLEESANSLGIDWLGKQAPLWIPDNEATNCLHCDMKFTVLKRRHHCRACGLVLCSKCCSMKYRLEYLLAEARVCKKCYDILNKDTNSSSGSEISQESSSPTRNLTTTHVSSNLGQPNPNNPLEYCSTIPPLQQVDLGAMAVPSVMVPVGVLKRKDSNKGRSNKSVMFCDGIRPGSDLTNLDTDFNYSDNQKAQKSKKSIERSVKSAKSLDMFDPETRSLIPSDENSLPPTVTIYKTDIKYSSCANNYRIVELLKNEPLIFAIQSNIFVHVKIVNLDCCVNRMIWCFSTEGLINVGQDEIVILLELIENESTVPKDIFLHLNNIYLEAVNGSSLMELSVSLHTSSPFLCSKNHAGFVYIRPTFQCLQNLIIPKEPYLIGILIHRWETPWAKLFPLRLVLRLGAEYKYYPSPIISTRERNSVFVEIGHTIINLLADFRNFSYTLPQIRGLTIHMQDKNTTVTIPVNRYDQVLKGLCNSSDHILAFAGNFSTSADSHLVCIQDTQSATNNYSTHAINICNQPRKVTGASFIVFNGALKSTSGLTAKSNIVEDGLMIQILPEHMLQVRESLRNMKNHVIKCGCVNEESDETVTIVWGEPDTSFNVGVLSPIDSRTMAGLPSIRVHNGKDYTCNSGSRLIRWTEVFIIQSGEESSRNQDPVDISKISENIAKATCQALVKYLDLLISNSFYKIGLRANLHVENVSYSAGSNNVKLPPIYMKSLDNELIPVLHRITSNNLTEQPIVLELIFRILNI